MKSKVQRETEAGNNAPNRHWQAPEWAHVQSRAELWVLIGCDCDPDTPGVGGTPYDGRAPLRWRGITDGIPRFDELRQSLTRAVPSSPVKVTWCVRADQQVHELHGHYAWAYSQFRGLWERMRNQGDELAWHPHVWRWSNEALVWYQETDDDAWALAWLPKAYAALAQAAAQRITAARTGWEWHSNQTMRALASVGIAIDFSAVPSRKSSGFHMAGSDRVHEVFDWEGTPEHPYRPSAADYRRPAREGEQQLDIWEVPKAAFRSVFWRSMSALRSAVRALRTGDPARVFQGPAWHSALNTAGLATHPAIFGCLISQKVNEAVRRGRALLSTSFHADELLPAEYARARVTAAEHIARNLRNLLEMAERRGVRVDFVTASQLHALLCDNPCAFGPDSATDLQGDGR